MTLRCTYYILVFDGFDIVMCVYALKVLFDHKRGLVVKFVTTSRVSKIRTSLPQSVILQDAQWLSKCVQSLVNYILSKSRLYKCN